MAEQVAGSMGPDVLTLQSVDENDDAARGGLVPGASDVALVPPRVRHTATVEAESYARRQRSVAIRHSSDDRIVALIEILSSGNKSSRRAFATFLDKVDEANARGFHLLLVDLQPPSPRDPDGIHAAIWAEWGGEPYFPPPNKPMTLASYDAGPPTTAYVEPVAVGDRLLEMPLFLAPANYVSLPLEETYQDAWRGVPRRWREMLER